jgi:hypothetical protein
VNIKGSVNRTALLKQMANGFPAPQSNYSRVPNALIDFLPLLSGADVKVLLYIIRHTWGYGDELKRITINDFVDGRQRKNGESIDRGAGVTRPTLLKSLNRLTELGLIVTFKDDSDLARKKRFYAVKSHPADSDPFFTPEVKKFYLGGKEILPRSKKDTLRKKDEGENDLLHPSLDVNNERWQTVTAIMEALLNVVNKGRTNPMQKYYFDGGKRETKLREAAEKLYDLQANMNRLDALFFNDGSWWYTESFGRNDQTPHPANIANSWEEANDWYDKNMVAWR